MQMWLAVLGGALSKASSFPVQTVGPAAFAVRQAADEVPAGEVYVLVADFACGGVAQVGQVNGRHASGLLAQQKDDHDQQAASCGQHNSSTHGRMSKS